MENRKRLSRDRNKQRDQSLIVTPDEKRCSTCKTTKLASDFSKAVAENDGLKSQCKACTKVTRAAWYAKNREQEIAKTLLYQQEHPDKKIAWARNTYYNNHESRKARNKAIYQANKEEISISQREYYLANKDEILIRCAKYRPTVQGKTKEYLRSYRLNNPDRIASLANAARTRKIDADGSHTAEEWNNLKTYFGHRCAYCLEPESNKRRLARDHIVPLSAGGSDYIENIAPCCKSCNSVKNARSLISFVRYRTMVAK